MMSKYKNTAIRRFIQSDSAFVLPGMIGVLVFILIPLLDVVRRSFVNAGHLGFNNYRIVLFNSAFQLAFRNTVRFEIVALPVLFVLSLLIAVVVKNMNNKYITFAFLIPMALPSNSVAIIWKILFDDHGVVNGILVNVLHRNAIGFFRGNAVFWLLVITFL